MEHHIEMTDDWLLSNSSKNLSDYDDKQMYNENVEFEIFQVKYLGSIDIEMPHSKQITATAIKRLIALAKGMLHVKLYEANQILRNLFSF